MPLISGFLYKVWYRIFNSIRLLICCICKFINKKGKEIFLSISIRWASTILRRVHVLLYPRSEVWDPAVDSIFACQSTFVSKAVVPDENMLGATLVSERTSGVSLRSEDFTKTSFADKSHQDQLLDRNLTDWLRDCVTDPLLEMLTHLRLCVT